MVQASDITSGQAVTVTHTPTPWHTTRRIGHGEAREVAARLINSHFRKEPHARVGIPARPDYDDDLLISAYIEQRKQEESTLVELLEDISSTLLDRYVDVEDGSYGQPEPNAAMRLMTRIDAALKELRNE